MTRGHLVAQRQRLNERGQDADLQCAELLGTELQFFGPDARQQELAREHLEDEQDQGQRDERGQADRDVHQSD